MESVATTWQPDNKTEPLPSPCHRFDNGSTLTNERTYGQTDDLQDQGTFSHVPDAPKPVENEVEVAVSRAELLRTRVTLAGLQARQERLRNAVNRSGLSSTADRLDFLIAQRSPDEALAWKRSWRALGIVRPEPSTATYARPESLSVPYAPRTPRRKKSEPVIPRDRQLEIALAVMAAREAREGGKQEAA